VPAISGLPSGELCGIAASMYASRCAFSPVTSTRPGGPGFRRRLSLAILLAHRRAPFDNDAAEREIRMGNPRRPHTRRHRNGLDPSSGIAIGKTIIQGI